MEQQEQQTVQVVMPPQKSRLQGALLALFLGGVGVHRFYISKPGSGAAMLVLTLLILPTFGATWLIVTVWAVVDFFLIVLGKMKGGYGRELC